MVVGSTVSFTAHLYDLYHISIFHLSNHASSDVRNLMLSQKTRPDDVRNLMLSQKKEAKKYFVT